MKNLRIIMLGGLVLSLCLPGSRLAAVESSPDDYQALHRQAKQLVKEGDTLLKAHRPLEARAKYLEASRLVNEPQIEMKQAQVEQQINQGIGKLLKAAEKSYQAKKYDAAIAKLEEARAWREGDATVLYNVALSKSKSGDKSGAIDAIGQAAAAVHNDGERMRLQELKSQWQTGEKPPPVASPENTEALRAINQQLSTGDDPDQTCQKLRVMTGSVAQSPSMIFNLAKCAEDEGRLDEAAQLLDKYFALAPHADQDRHVEEDLHSILSLQQRVGPEVMKEYAAADRLTRMGRHRQAVLALEHTESQTPDLPETQLRLARLLQGRGDTAQARRRYDKYLVLETNADQKAIAQEERETLEQRAMEYDQLVKPASERLRALLARYVSDGRPMGPSAARAELKGIADQLQRASLMSPLAADVNLMLGCVYLNGGSYGAARKAFSAAWDGGSPVWFYGDVDGSAGWDGVRSKIEIRADEIRIIGLSKYDKKRKRNATYLDAVNPDGVGGLLSPYGDIEGKKHVLRFSSDAIKSVETDNDTVRIVWIDKHAAGSPTERELTIHPLKITVPDVIQGAAARKFANPFTRLFRDFADRKVKLGPEHMTGGEKFGMAMSVAAAAYAGGGLGAMNGMSTTAQRISVAVRSVTWATTAL